MAEGRPYCGILQKGGQFKIHFIRIGARGWNIHRIRKQEFEILVRLPVFDGRIFLTRFN